MYLFRLAKASSYRELSAQFNISDRYCTSVAWEVGSAIRIVFGSEISWPSRQEAMRSVDVFRARVGIANCVAAMDGTDISHRPAMATRHAEYSHKKAPAIKLHAVCNSE